MIKQIPRSVIVFLGGAVLLFVFLAVQIGRSVSKLRLPPLAAGEIMLEDVTYRALTPDGTEVTVRAVSALPENNPPTFFRVMQPHARLLDKSGLTSEVTAARGRYDFNKSLLTAEGRVVITRSNGVSLNSERAMLDLNRGSAEAEGAVKFMHRSYGKE